jgi:hypothetical protein
VFRHRRTLRNKDGGKEGLDVVQLHVWFSKGKTLDQEMHIGKHAKVTMVGKA